MKKVNPKDYDFLWIVEGHNYLFTSIWLTKEYLKRDFLVFVVNGDFHCYVSKSERKKIGKQILSLYSSGFSKYEKNIRAIFPLTEKVFGRIRKLDFPKLSNKQLGREFVGLIKHIKRIWNYYFWTEYFCTDLIEEILIKNKNDRLTRTLAKNVKKMAELKYEQRKYLNQTFFAGNVLERFYEEIKKRLSLGDKISNYSYEELVSMLNSKNIAVTDKSFVVIGKFNDWLPVVGEEAKEIISSFKEGEKTAGEIKGGPASPGFVTGRAYVLPVGLYENYSEKIKNMKEGDILVTMTTGPEMILACKKAKAIVTDEGGIVSHAALVSRELGVPCIVGTGRGTQIIKTGDYIEVDAENGVVKVLNRK